jgi:ankyrin repeat protein
MVLLLLEARANPTLTNVWGHTPMDSAIQHDRWNVLTLLAADVGSGGSSASSASMGSVGSTVMPLLPAEPALTAAAHLPMDVLDKISLASALQHNQWRAIGALVVARRARLEDVTSNPSDMLRQCVRADETGLPLSPQLFKLLLVAKADVNYAGESGDAPLHLAVMGGCAAFLSFGCAPLSTLFC